MKLNAQTRNVVKEKGMTCNEDPPTQQLSHQGASDLQISESM